MKNEIKKKIPDENIEHKKKVELDSLHHQIQNGKVRLNDTIGCNNELKVNIDIMRKEILFAKASVQEMSEQIARLKVTAKEANKISI